MKLIDTASKGRDIARAYSVRFRASLSGLELLAKELRGQVEYPACVFEK